MGEVVAQPVNQASRLDHLFRPQTIAVVGASSTLTKIGGLPIAFLLANEFAGEIFPINPYARDIQGLTAYASLGEVAGRVDLVIVAVPAAKVAQTVDDAIAAQARGIVLFSAGFAEVGADGARAQAELVARAQAAGVPLLGPNCLGFMNLSDKVFATFSPVVDQGITPVGRIGLVSQSGAFGAYAFTLARERDLGLRYCITTGNEGGVDFADCVAWLAGDPDIDVILGYMEGCRDGRKLQAALAAARAAGKPVVITKVGRSAIGAAAAASHTAAIAGEDAIYDALFRQYGVYRAYSIEEFFDVGHAVAVAGRAAGNHLGIFTVSGGAGVLMADDAADAGLVLPELSAAGQAKICAQVPFAAARNPVDITGQITNDLSLFEASLEIMLNHSDYQMIIAFLAAAGLGPMGEDIVGQIAAVRRRYPDRIFCVVSVFTTEIRKTLEHNGCLTFQDPSRAIRALAALAWLARNRPTPSFTAALEPIQPQSLQARCYSEAESFDQLAAAGIMVPDYRLARSISEAAEAATAFKGPMVAKIASGDITHKSDIGGVRLNLAGAEELRDAFETLVAAASNAYPNARIDGVLIAPMESGGVECIVGIQRDPIFGPVVMLGLGGVLVEVLRDVSFRIAPLTQDMALAMIDELKGKELLFGARGRPAADVDALATLLVRVSKFAVAAGDTLASLDINPVSVRPRGQGVVPLDSLLVGRCPGSFSTVGKRSKTMHNATPSRDPAELTRLAQRAYLYTAPLVIMETTRKWRLAKGANVFNHARNLLNHHSRVVTTPNNDTLYSDAWLDLSSGPVTITVPPTGERYFSLAFMDMYTNNFAILGTRTTGGDGGIYTLVGPNQAVPEGWSRVVRAPTPRVWALARILVDGEGDLAAARSVQDGLFIHEGAPGDDVEPGDPVLRSAVWRDYFRAANRLLKRERPPITDERMLNEIAPLGIGPDQSFDPEGFDDDQALAIEAGMENAKQYLVELQGARGAVIQGWTYPDARNGDYRQNYLLRAVVAVGGLGALPPEEALYMRADGDQAAGLFDGSQDYVLHFPAGAMPPLESFWSLSLYEATDEGQFFFADTHMRRYAIGDRSPGLSWNADGSLDIWIGARSPGAAHESNWLPAPKGYFALTFRGYIPQAPLLDGRYRLPPVARVNGFD